MAKPYFDGLMLDLQDLDSFQPPNPEDFHANAEMDVGWEGVDGKSTFYFLLATPAGLLRRGPRRNTKHLLAVSRTMIVARFDKAELLAVLKRTIEGAVKETDDETIQCLSRYFVWEYEDAVPFEGGSVSIVDL